MDSTNPELAQDLSPLIKIYKDGRVERLISTEIVPSSFDPETNVECKDALYSLEYNLYVRLYLPKNTHQNQKLPLLVYFRGGGFVIGTVFAPINHNFLNILVSEANIIAVSVDYKNAPEHPLPAAFNDSWSALRWVASHFNQKGPEDWLNRYADFQRVFFSGDSAGGNIAHQMAIKHGHEEKLEGLNITGLILCHPFFWGEKPIPGESKEEWQRNWIERLWKVVNPTTGGLDDDPWINPANNPNLDRLGCERVQVFVSEKDPLRERGWYYCLKLRESGWSGDMEVIDYKGEEHVFHLENITCENSVSLRKKIVQFINQLDKVNEASKTIFIACEEDMEEALSGVKKGILTFSGEWLMKCIMKQELDLETPQFAESLLDKVNEASKTIFIACEEDMEEALSGVKKGILTFSGEWLMKCIMKQELDLETPQFAESL